MVKQMLLGYYPLEHKVNIISSAGLADQEIDTVELCALERSGRFDRLTCIYVPPNQEFFPAKDIQTLLGLLRHLRSPQGCPGDKEQTSASLVCHALEERYEVADAIAEGDGYKICEELGDLLLQIVFHCQIAAEQGQFDFGDVVQAITSKLIRRHPHVSGDKNAHTPEEVSSLWAEIKEQEPML
jgi:tetrapyrrole methylase family protein/MazG family protein